MNNYTVGDESRTLNSSALGEWTIYIF